jgi:hypothetical protein
VRRRLFLAHIASAVAAGTGLVAAKAGPAVQRVMEQSPRYIWDPERQVMTERIQEGVYRVMQSWRPQ